MTKLKCPITTCTYNNKGICSKEEVEILGKKYKYGSNPCEMYEYDESKENI